jgi:hypothetical protein
MITKRDENGIWHIEADAQTVHPTYSSALAASLNGLDPLFIKAKQKSEFEYIITLIRTFSLSDAGWDTLKNLEEVFEIFNEIKKIKKEYRTTIHFSLFIYGLITEASEPYEIIANLINVASGDRARALNFPDEVNTLTKKSTPQHPKKKIDQIISRARQIGVDLKFMGDLIDSPLRNAVFHSDYTVHGAEVRINKPHPKIYSEEDRVSIANRALAYYESLMRLYYLHIQEYDKPVLIDPHPDFQRYQNEKVQIIVRKDYGVTGIKDNLTKTEIAGGKIPFRLGRFTKKDLSLIENGEYLLPKNRLKQVNKLLKKLPLFVAVPLSKIIQKYELV